MTVTGQAPCSYTGAQDGLPFAVYLSNLVVFCTNLSWIFTCVKCSCMAFMVHNLVAFQIDYLLPLCHWRIIRDFCLCSISMA